jgi:hypothetical protein
MAKRKTARATRKKAEKPNRSVKSDRHAVADISKSSHTSLATSASDTAVGSVRLLPIGAELKTLYQRYTNGATFDDHDKAFYFVLDVGGLNRAKQLLAHVEEVLAELEEVRG